MLKRRELDIPVIVRRPTNVVGDEQEMKEQRPPVSPGPTAEENVQFINL